jgi:hypothetical protein
MSFIGCVINKLHIVASPFASNGVKNELKTSKKDEKPHNEINNVNPPSEPREKVSLVLIL